MVNQTLKQRSDLIFALCKKLIQVKNPLDRVFLRHENHSPITHADKASWFAANVVEKKKIDSGGKLKAMVGTIL